MSKTPLPPENESAPKADPKRRYEKPAVVTENLTAVAALCNGTSTGGRKATTPACSAGKLKS